MFEAGHVPSLEGWIAIGRAIGPVPDAARAPLAVAAEILSTRLNISVREVRGLANRTVCLVPTAASGAGLLHIRSGGRPDAVGPIVKFSLDELRRIHSAEDVIGADELETAKGALALGLWQTSLDGARSTSSTRAGPRPVRAAIWTASAGSQRRRFRSTKVVQHFQRLN